VHGSNIGFDHRQFPASATSERGFDEFVPPSGSS
jgi:hypothetical protein